MNEATKNLFLALYLHHPSCEAYVEWAIACLEDGLDSKNLRMLAALEKPYYSFEVEARFQRALAELGITRPEQRQLLRLCRLMCGDGSASPGRFRS